MDTQKITIRILDIPSGAILWGCAKATGCGKSIAQQTDELRDELERSFPGLVEVDYVDLNSRPEEVKTIEAALMLTGVYPPPIIYINGEARYASTFPQEDIRQEVAKLLRAA
jgi:hypothetical protein